MTITARRHWVTALLVVWMFADAAQMLFWTMSQLYTLWEFHHRPPSQPLGRPGMHAGMWVVAIWYNFRLLLSLLPSPHFLQVLHQIPWVRRRLGMDLHPVTLWFDLAVAGMTVALGYGLLRMREWARWCYAGVCVFAIVSLGGVQFGLFLWPLNLMGGFILPIALLIFLFRRGLSAAPRGGSPSPVPSAGFSL